MRGMLVVAIAALAAVPLVTTSNVVLNFLVSALLIALVAQGWNVLGGYGGARVIRHIPAPVLRRIVVALGLAMSAYFFWRRFG